LPTVSQDNWDVEYYWSHDSGLQLGACDYQGIRVLWKASVPFVYVNYLGGAWGPFTDQLRSTSQQVEVRQIMRGFDIRVTYDFYGPDYEYDHIWRFHDDGQFGSSVVIHGPGEEIYGRHTYHVPFRFDIDISGASGDSFQAWVSSGAAGYWVDVPREGRRNPATAPSAEYDWQVIDKAANRRALIRAGEGDSAEIWALQYSEIESWSTWGGAQAKPPGSAGSVPAVYDSDQSVQNADLVLWYLTHVSSRDLVATCGPWFRLAGFPAAPTEPEEPNHDHDDNHDH
jgi:hypothetical protein